MPEADIRVTIVCRERCGREEGTRGDGEEGEVGAIDWATRFFAGDERFFREDTSVAERVDAHHHLWRYSPEEYGWIDESMAVLQRDFLPKDLMAEIASGGDRRHGGGAGSADDGGDAVAAEDGR